MRIDNRTGNKMGHHNQFKAPFQQRASQKPGQKPWQKPWQKSRAPHPGKLVWTPNNNGKKWLAPAVDQSNAQQNRPTTQVLGMTSAISHAGPTQQDIDSTAALAEVMKPFDLIESEAEMNHRLQVLAKLDRLAKDWMRDVGISKNLSPEMASKLGGKIHTFGSYRLGVHNRGADIDALCMAPRTVDRADFFKSFVMVLKQLPEVTELRAIEDAFVPVIKMKFDGIEIDLLFAQLALAAVHDDMDLQDDKLLKGLDEKCVRSLNGCRVGDELLRLVPHVQNFQSTLRVIKLWAKRQGIYSNSLGYFGGIAWAMLVVRVCQLYPNAAVSKLVHRFFMVFKPWEWGCSGPVMIKPIGTVNLGYKNWDPRVVAEDRTHLMPIITPAYPHHNSTYNVNASTKQVIMDELARGLSIVEEIASGNATWDQFFEPSCFFGKYRHFVVLLANARNEEDRLAWGGLVEVKTRVLVTCLGENPDVTLAHVHPKQYEYKASADSSTLTPSTSPPLMWFVGLQFKQKQHLNIDFTENIAKFQRKLLGHAVSIRLK